MSRNRQKIENLTYSVLFIIFIAFVIHLNHKKLSGLTFSSNKISINKIEKKVSAMDALNKSAVLLSIPKELFTIYQGEDAIYIKLGLDRNKLDLNYANAIITGQIDNIGAELVSGKVKRNGERQVLQFNDPIDSQRYVVSLYYSSENYKKPSTKLAIVVDDFGARNNTLLKDFCSLDKAVTFAILPDLKYSQTVMQMANDTGHETIVHIPMEPISYPRHDPGPNAIYVHLSEKEIKRRVNKFIEQFPLCIGANNHMGSLATSDHEVMKTVLETLKENNLYFVDSRTSQSSIAYSLATKMMMPTAENKLFLDTPTITKKSVETKLSQLEYLKKRNDKILVITHCATEARYEFLKEFIEEAKKRGFELVPVSNFFNTELPEIL
ncbi:MAG: divergent polysaccharide deacetylase family protein [Candidatus Cloacimonetes bacterium]|nr:divergent polysaccharide deacetylase family protein [Candidatus Cloacimonadota bacterium]